ncbi:MAG: hypothetical protein ACKV19_29255 [Verrucomicrobiales bacterium]
MNSTVGFPILIMAALMAALPLTGAVIGFSALRDIREAKGRLGGAGWATAAAGFLPALIILILCGGGLSRLAEEVLHRPHNQVEFWAMAGVALGCWVSFLLLRGMYRRATGWVRPVPQQTSPASGLTVAAIVLTIVGAALLLLLLVSPAEHRAVLGGNILHERGAYLVSHTYHGMALLMVMALLGGLICGVIGRREAAAKFCAWISGSLFVVAVLLFS